MEAILRMADLHGRDSKAREALRTYLQQTHLPPGVELEVDDDADLFDAGILDSAALLSFVRFIELEFELSIPDEDLLPENFASIHAALRYLASRRGAAK